MQDAAVEEVRKWLVPNDRLLIFEDEDIGITLKGLFEQRYLAAADCANSVRFATDFIEQFGPAYRAVVVDLRIGRQADGGERFLKQCQTKLPNAVPLVHSQYIGEVDQAELVNFGVERKHIFAKEGNGDSSGAGNADMVQSFFRRAASILGQCYMPIESAIESLGQLLRGDAQEGTEPAHKNGVPQVVEDYRGVIAKVTDAGVYVSFYNSDEQAYFGRRFSPRTLSFDPYTGISVRCKVVTRGNRVWAELERTGEMTSEETQRELDDLDLDRLLNE